MSEDRVYYEGEAEGEAARARARCETLARLHLVALERAARLARELERQGKGAQGSWAHEALVGARVEVEALAWGLELARTALALAERWPGKDEGLKGEEEKGRGE